MQTFFSDSMISLINFYSFLKGISFERKNVKFVFLNNLSQNIHIKFLKIKW